LGEIYSKMDNAPHHRELRNYLYYIYLGENRIKANMFVPNILKISDEIESCLQQIK